MSTRRERAAKRNGTTSNQWDRIKAGFCPRCDERAKHYVPPGSGIGAGFYVCESAGYRA